VSRPSFGLQSVVNKCKLMTQLKTNRATDFSL
jgi:hypothetical protein